MKRILIVTTISGFLPQFEKNDVKILQDMGYEIHYASNFHHPVYRCDKDALIEQGIHLHQIDVEKSPVKFRKNYKAFRQIKKIIDCNAIDAVHCHNPMGGVVGRMACHFSKRKPYVIYTAHGFHFYQGAKLQNWILYYTAERFLAGWTDHLVTINREDYQNAKKFCMQKGGRVSQIHGVGVDAERFRPNPEIAGRMRKEIGIPETAFHIVTAAELNDNKNQSVIIHALALLDCPMIHYTLCGRGDNRKKLEALVKQKGLEKQVHFLGYRDDMPDILQTADCFAFPSKREGLGIAAVEALLCGVPLLVADNRGTREYAKNGINGIVCYTQKVGEYADAIRSLYENKKLRRDLAERARESAKEFTIQETERRMQSVYQTIADKG
ncbi:MAG: glycosyltransferase family 4 protein [Lachnospiraceae bacterium]